MKNDKKKIVLVGSGISGLSSLYFFLKEHANQISVIEVFEKDNHIGGVLSNTKSSGFLLEHGAQGVLSTRDGFKSLIADLSLENECVATLSKTAHRSFFFKDRVIKISPSNLVQMFRVRLLSLRMMFRVLCEFFAKKPNTLQMNETVQDFFTRRFGTQFVTNFIKPVMKGIWGGGTSQVLMRFAFPKLQEIEQEHSSLLRYSFKNMFKQKKVDSHSKDENTGSRPRKEILSFKGGMQTLPLKILSEIEALCATNNIALNIHLNCTVVKIGHNTISILNSQGNNPQVTNITTDMLIYSGQPWRDHALTFEFPNDRCLNAYATLKKINSHSLTVVGIGSANSDVLESVAAIDRRTNNTSQNTTMILEGFGALAVEDNPEGVLGVICVHSLQKDHVPQGSFLYRVLMNFGSHSDSELIQRAKQYLGKHNLLWASRTYAFEHVVHHKNFLPLPMFYQDAVIQAVETLEHEMPGMFFVGNYLLGPSIENCVAQAQKTALKMSQYFARDEKQN